MAYMNTTRTAQLGLSDRFAQIVKSVKVAMQRRQIYGRTVRELNALSNRELTDLGIHRAMISQIAREAAYGK